MDAASDQSDLPWEAISEHALTQEYGPKERLGLTGPLPNTQIGLAILAVAGADGEVSDNELTFLLGRARQFGVSDEGIRTMRSFDYRSADLAAIASQVPPSVRKVVLYDAILVARCDGFADPERRAAERWATALGLDTSLVREIEQHLEREEELRAERLQLFAP
jgi:uncharacterized membrane protein YebE (DUF533 family)